MLGIRSTNQELHAISYHLFFRHTKNNPNEQLSKELAWVYSRNHSHMHTGLNCVEPFPDGIQGINYGEKPGSYSMHASDHSIQCTTTIVSNNE